MSAMEMDPQIDIEQQQWRIIPPELKDGLSRQRLSKRRLRNWTLVLQARQIPCRSEQGEDGRQLLVPIAYFSAACEELRIYETENHNWPPPPPQQPVQQENTASTIWVLVALGLFHLLVQQQLSLFGLATFDWHGLGNAHASKILSGDWWRLVTALTLHSGGVHLMGNIVVGGIFINRLCRELGSGLGWCLVLASGILGNLANAFVQAPDHRSIGASTAVFGAVGLLAAINTMRYRDNLRRRWPLPVAAALGLLALLGAGGENTDIGAHLFGFTFGLGLGVPAGYWVSKSGPLPTVASRSLAASGLGILLLSWWFALHSG